MRIITWQQVAAIAVVVFGAVLILATGSAHVGVATLMLQAVLPSILPASQKGP